MILYWPYLALAAALTLVAVSLFAMMRLEQRSGQGFLLFWKPASWTRNAHPNLFKARMGFYWIGILTFIFAALADFAASLGIVR